MPAIKATHVVLAGLVACLLASHVMLWRHVSAPDVAVTCATAAPASPPPVVAEVMAEGARPPELAPYMTKLQGLTQKLGLSIAAGDAALARFYLYESREQVSEILETVPEYRGYPIALLAERFLDPPYEHLATAMDDRAGRHRLTGSYHALVTACNDCHRATQHGFVRIPTSLPSHNPYLQTFALEHRDAL